MSLSVIDRYVTKKEKDLLEYAKILETIISIDDNKIWQNKKEFISICRDIIEIYSEEYYFQNNKHKDNPIEYLNDNINYVLKSLIEYCRLHDRMSILKTCKNEMFLTSVIVCTACYVDFASNVVDGDYFDTKNKFKYLLNYLRKTKVLVIKDNKYLINDLFDALKRNLSEDKKIIDGFENGNYYNTYKMIAKDSNGKLYSWGDNDYGQLGDGTTTDSSMPICISDIENSPLREKNIVKIYREENSIIVKDSSGKLYTWGENDYGQLGDGTTTNSSMPICISDMENSPLNGKDIVDVYNDFGIIAKSSDGKLYSWGNNSSTIICVNDMQDSPLKGKNVVDIYYGYGTIMAKDSNGKLYSWGGNGYGQLGDGTTGNSSMPICISDVENSELKGKKIKNVEYNSYNNGIYHNSFEVYYYVTENGEYYEYSFTPIQ